MDVRTVRKIVLIPLALILLIGGGIGYARYNNLMAHLPDAPSGTPLHVMGSLSAPVRVTVFTDFECPHCRKFHQSHLLSLQEQFGDKIVVIYKNYPRPEHLGAMEKAQAAECVYKIAGDAAYWKYIARLFDTEPHEYTADVPDAPYTAATYVGVDAKAVRACVKSGEKLAQVQSDLAEVENIHGTATPVIYVTGGTKAFVIQGDRGNGTNISIRAVLGS